MMHILILMLCLYPYFNAVSILYLFFCNKLENFQHCYFGSYDSFLGIRICITVTIAQATLKFLMNGILLDVDIREITHMFLVWMTIDRSTVSIIEKKKPQLEV